MANNLTRTIAVLSTLVVAGLGLSACVSNGYDPYPRYGYTSGYDNHRWDGRRWVDRNHDGYRDSSRSSRGIWY